MRRLSSTATALALLLSACGGGGSSTDLDPGGDPTTEEEETPGDAPDTTPPTVVAMSPENGASGVRDDAAVVIEFSEAMDKLSVQDSLDVSDLQGVTYAWSDEDTVLTITPDDPLEYAEGINTEETDALQYAVTLGIGAKDVAGNPLVQGSQTVFTTLRRISTNVEDINELTASISPSEIIGGSDEHLFIGDDGDGGAAVGSRGLITMDLSTIHDDAEEIESAILHAHQPGYEGNVFVELGALLVDHATYEVNDDSWDSATYNDINWGFNLEALASVGVLMGSDADVFATLDVTESVQDDLENREERLDRSQFRLRLFNDLNLDDDVDRVWVARDGLYLELQYLVP